MIKNTNKLTEVINKIAETRNTYAVIRLLVFALDEVLSMNDFNLLIERLKEDIEEDVEE
jgi:hypothetical protein